MSDRRGFYRRQRRSAAAIQQFWMDAIGEDGGHLTWESSPFVMWWLNQMAKKEAECES